MTRYLKGKWLAAISDPASGFYVALLSSDVAEYLRTKVGGRYRPLHRNRRGCGGHSGCSGCGDGDRGGCGGCGGCNKACHNCGCPSHIDRTCRFSVEGDYNHNANRGGDDIDNEEDNKFPGAAHRVLCCPLYGAENRTLTLPDGTSVKWWSLCGYRGTHFRVTHTDANAVAANNEGQLCGESTLAKEEVKGTNNFPSASKDMPRSGIIFARLRASGLIWKGR